MPTIHVLVNSTDLRINTKSCVLPFVMGMRDESPYGNYCIILYFEARDDNDIINVNVVQYVGLYVVEAIDIVIRYNYSSATATGDQLSVNSSKT
jgi:hypothetical protein